ncbi:MAG: hypothetical protein ACR2FY_03545 [Pirellulaceae bacterium]
MNFWKTSVYVPSSFGLALLLAVASSVGCRQRITSTAKPNPPPGIAVRLPDLQASGVNSSPETTRVPVLQRFKMNVTVHGIDAQARKQGRGISIHFLPLKGSEDEAKKWFYGAATLFPKDINAATWECTGICEGVAKPAPMRAVIAIGDVATEIPFAEVKVEAVADFKPEEVKPGTPK